jgi:hypothetical protein
MINVLEKFDLLIPVSNAGGDDFYDRLKNVQMTVNATPAQYVNLYIIEQIIDESYPTFYNNLKLRKGVNYISCSYKEFNKSWLYNIGYKQSKSEYIILGESDCTPNCPFRYYKDMLKYVKTRLWFFGWSKLIYLDKTGKAVVKVVEPKRGYAEGGFVFFTREYFARIGYANEFIEHLGGIDNELADRARLFQSDDMFKWTIFHHWHRPSYMKDFRKGSRSKNTSICRNVRTNTGAYIDKLRSLNVGSSKPLKQTMSWDSLGLPV